MRTKPINPNASEFRAVYERGTEKLAVCHNGDGETIEEVRLPYELTGDRNIALTHMGWDVVDEWWTDSNGDLNCYVGPA